MTFIGAAIAILLLIITEIWLKWRATTHWVFFEPPVIRKTKMVILYYPPSVLAIPYCHHEKWDSTGYPRGLKGEQISLAARIFAVVDVYDTLTSDRSYRKAWSKERAVTYIREQASRHFDSHVVEAFLRIEG